ncbi:hypothetical protein [Sporomusa sp.]|jgi:hypothetical protein|uniref:hypothetical protein n=1 Tax=Sporomusa sp. TaxID=2078658 RepID=UPI002D0709D8|nr:hypothetical protein [Sporomusa sp.]MDF2873999.1 hypothetical protein [Sporomusa sp.]HWR05824.1 hypothetical protein [Sporomusa sp.]
MSQAKELEKNKAGRLRIVFGNTDRTAEEIIAQIHRHVSEFAGLNIEAAKSVPKHVGQVVVDVQVATANIDTAKLRRNLNEAGSCMFQVDSIEQI